MDILESVSFVHILFQIGNLSQLCLVRKSWTLRPSRFLEVYAIFTIFAASGFLVFGLFKDEEFNNTSRNEIGETVDFIQMVGIRLAHVVSTTESLLTRTDQEKFFAQVREIDKIFEFTLNVNMDNRGFRHYHLKRGALMVFIYLASEIFILVTKLLATESKFPIYWILYLCPFLVCGLRYFQIFNAIMIIKRRFDKLIVILDELNLELASSVEAKAPTTLQLITQSKILYESRDALQKRYDMENPQLKRLLTIRDLYNRLWELASNVNRSYGVSILINVGNDFISITSNCYWMFLSYKEYASTPMEFVQIVGSAVWSIPHLLNVLVLAILCERTVSSTTSLALGLHRIQFDVANDNHNTVIQQFSLQLLHQKMAFTAAGFFDVNCTLLYTIAGATTTYLIILIQFHMTEQKSSNG